MVEILSNSLAITTTSHGYSCPYHSYSPGIHEYRTRYPFVPCCMYLSSDMKSNRRRAKSYGLKIMMTLPYPWRKDVKSSNGCDSSFLFQQKVAIVEYGLACEEENILSRREEEETDLNLLKPKPSPWGNSSIQLESDYETSPANQSLTVSERAGPRNDNRHRVHFLEERNEGRLSERILNLSRTNKSRSAMELYWSMEYSGLKPTLHACNSLISCLLRNKMIDDALCIFKAMKASDNITGHTCSLILKAIGNARGCDAALDIFEELGRNGHCKVFDTVVYNTMISICGQGSDWVETLRIWRNMKDNGLTGTAVTYSLLVSIFVHCGQNELAIDAYHEMLQERLNPRQDEMQAIIGACSKEGMWHLALDVFENMLKRGLKPNLVTCNALTNVLGKHGKVKLAFRIHHVLKSLGHSPDTYTWNALIGALYRANRHEDALHLFESIQKEKMSQLDLHIYNTCLMSCQRLGWWDKALQLLWQMEASGIPVSTPSYNLVIGACEVARKPNVALEVYKHMLDRKCASDTFTLSTLIRVCIWGSLWYEVEEILNQGTPDASLYNAAIQGMCLRGKIGLAKKLYATMRSISLKPDGKTRALMLQIFTERPVPVRKR